MPGSLTMADLCVMGCLKRGLGNYYLEFDEIKRNIQCLASNCCGMRLMSRPLRNLRISLFSSMHLSSKSFLSMQLNISLANKRPPCVSRTIPLDRSIVNSFTKQSVTTLFDLELQ